jgi:hypothetical protein
MLCSVQNFEIIAELSLIIFNFEPFYLTIEEFLI